MKKRTVRRGKLGWLIALAVVAVLAVLCVFAFSEKLSVSEYTVFSDKVSSGITIVQISDLHNCVFGEGNRDLLDAVDALRPDIVALTGDIADPRSDKTPSIDFARAISAKYPCFYVIGNHENSYAGRSKKICAEFEQAGLTVFHGDGQIIDINGSRLLVCGIDDPLASPDYNLDMWEQQLEKCDGMIEDGLFSVLLSHRPECVDYYASTSFDLVLAGHAHGGQARLPLVLPQGLYAPNQGFFPKYTSGRFELGDRGTVMIVSRGLSTRLRPRVFNRPDIVKISILPK